MRKVASLGGVKYYGLPIGTPITADVLEKARAANGGKPAPKGSTKQTRATSATPPPPKGIKAPPVVKPAKPAEPTLAERLQGIKAKKPLEGPEHFRVGNSNFPAPEGTRVFYMDGREDVGLVVPPEGDLRVFNERGEVAISSRTEARVKAEMINAGESLEEVLLGEEEDEEETSDEGISTKTPPKKAAKKAAKKPAKKPEVQAVDFDYDPESPREQAIKKSADAKAKGTKLGSTAPLDDSGAPLAEQRKKNSESGPLDSEGQPTEYDLRDKPKDLSEAEVHDRARKQFEARQKAAETRRKNMAARSAATQAMLERELDAEGQLPPVSYEDRIRARQEKKAVNDLVETSNLKIRELSQESAETPLPGHLSREEWMPAGQVLDRTSGRLVADPTASPELVKERQLLEMRQAEADRVSAAADRLLARYDEENPSAAPQITKEQKQEMEKKKVSALRAQLKKYLSAPGKQKKLLQPTRKPDSLGQSVQVDSDDIADLQTSIFSAPHLNPDGTFTEERKKLHDDIIASFLDGVEASENPVQYMNGGGPASGKGTMTKGRNAELTNYPATRKVDDESPEGAFEELDGTPEAVLIDPDSMKMQLPEVKEARQRIADGTYDPLDPHWASNAHTESSYLAARLHVAALDRGLNLIFDGTGNGKESSVLGKALSARKAGYRIEANYLYLEPEEGIKRAKSRADRSHRVVPEAVITGTYKNIPPIFDAVKEGVFDKVNLFDNNVEWGQPAKVIGQGGGDQFNIADPEAYARFQKLSDKLQQTRTSRGDTPPPTASSAASAPKGTPAPAAGKFDRSFREVSSSEFGTVISNKKGEQFIFERNGWSSLAAGEVRDSGGMSADDWKVDKAGDGGKPTPSPEREETPGLPGITNGSEVEQRQLGSLPIGTVVVSEDGDLYASPEQGSDDWVSLDGGDDRSTTEMTGRWKVAKLGESQRMRDKQKPALPPINPKPGESIPQRLLSRLPLGSFIKNSKGELFEKTGNDQWTGPDGVVLTTAEMAGDWDFVKGPST